MAEEVTWPVLYPVSLRLDGTSVVVVGGGTVATRKIDRLLGCGAVVEVVAPEGSAEVEAWAASGRIEWTRREFEPSDLDGARLVLAATSRREVNEAVAAAARGRRVWVNVADVPDLCTFHLPALVDMHPLTVAVSTSGASPAFARFLRESIEAWLGPAAGGYVALLGEMRERARKRAPERLGAISTALARSSAWALWREGQRDAARAELERILEEG